MLINIKISRNSAFFQAQISLECYFSCSKIVGILTFMSRKNLMLSLVEHEIFRTSGTVFLMLDEGETESVYNRLGILYSERSL